MTNRQWLIWQLIDMSDEEFADRLNGLGWFCTICSGECGHGAKDCRQKFVDWLQQEHVDSNAI
jgi:hypothetical protein